MAVEVALIQRYTLFVGASVYSVTTILLTLLVAAGLGSRYSARVGDTSAFACIVMLVLIEVTVFRGITSLLAFLPIYGRVLVTATLLAPLGFFMGMPFPKAVERVGDLVDWGFSVNGAASVFGATAAVMVAFSWGFVVALLFAATLYALAFGLLATRAPWVHSSRER